MRQIGKLLNDQNYAQTQAFKKRGWNQVWVHVGIQVNNQVGTLVWDLLATRIFMEGLQTGGLLAGAR